MANSEKCAHESCVCLVNKDGGFGAYCSAHCRDAKAMSELRCECGHAGCIADAARRPASPGGPSR
jgi:hypothetical protein